MNDFFNFNDLESLVAHSGKLAVSIYLPTTRIPTRVQAESLQFKNLLRDAEELLNSFGMPMRAVTETLQPARDLIGNTEFWRHQQDGLAVFMAEDFFQRYQVPVSFESGLFVSQAFHLKPLLPLLTNDRIFYILAVSQNRVRFFRCTPYSVTEIDPKNVPDSLQEVVGEYDFEKELQFHTATAAGGTGRSGATYHGQGSSVSEDEKTRLREYFDRIDRGIQEYLNDRTAPLVFAGVDYLFPIYQEANTYPHLLDKSIVGNPDDYEPRNLHLRARNLLTPLFEAARDEAIERFYVSQPRNQTSLVLREIVPWADKGRVESIFVNRDATVWGLYDRDNFAVEEHASMTQENRDLTDLAAIYTLLREGEVYLLTPEEMEMEFGPHNRHHKQGSPLLPQSTPVVAATYRYAV